MPITGSYVWPTPEDVESLRSTFLALIPFSELFCEGLYDRLFEADPSVRGLFPEQMEDQRDKMVMLLADAIDRLESPDEFIALARACGRRHREYGAKPEQFAAVAGLLVEQLEATLDPKLNEVELKAWHNLVTVLSQEMLTGFGRTVSGPTPS